MALAINSVVRNRRTWASAASVAVSIMFDFDLCFGRSPFYAYKVEMNGPNTNHWSPGYFSKSTFATATNFLKDVVSTARVYTSGKQNTNKKMVEEFDEKIIQLQKENPNSDLVGFSADEVMDIFGIKAIRDTTPKLYEYNDGIAKLYHNVKPDNWQNLVTAINGDIKPRTAKFILDSLNNCKRGLTAVFTSNPPVCKEKLYLVKDIYSLINTTSAGASVGGRRTRHARKQRGRNRRSKRTRRR